MKEMIVLTVKGFIMGIANIIPGVSGGTLAIILGIYEDLIGAISHFFHNWKQNLKLLIPLGIGIVLSLFLFSKVISYSLERYALPTTLFFIGLILGGIPLLLKKIHHVKKKPYHIIAFMISFLLVILFGVLQGKENVVSLSHLQVWDYIFLFLVGMITSATMIIPGISGSFVLMMLGYYKPIIDTIKNLTNFDLFITNMTILIPFGIGVLVGIVSIAKLLEYLFKRHEQVTYFAILGFVFASIITIFMGATGFVFTPLSVLCGFLLLIIGMVITYRLGER